MQYKIELKLDGLERMERLAERLGTFDRAGLMRRLGERVKQQHIKRILAEKTAPDGSKWAPLLPSTIAEKGNANILVRTGAMAGAYSLASSATRAEISNKTFYLKFHQGGTRKMAQRRPMGLSAANIAELQTILNQFVATMMR